MDMTSMTPEEMARLDGLFQKGIQNLNRSEFQSAIKVFESILDEGFRNGVLLSTYGNALKGDGQFNKAVSACREACDLMPGNLQCFMNLGSALLASGDWQGAVSTYETALGDHPGESEVHFNLGTAWLEGRELDKARAALQRAVSFDRESFRGWVNLGAVRKLLGDLDGCRQAYEKAVAIDPEEPRAQWNLSLAELTDGEYLSGWERYEWRRQVEDIPVRDFPMREWDGRIAPEENLLIHSEQGLGDTLQFVRLAQFAKTRVKNVCVLAPRPLVPVLELSGIADFVAGDTSELPPCHYHIPMLSLPRITGGGFLDSISGVPYLKAAPALRDHWREKLATRPGFNVGICWQGNPGYKEDGLRSVPLFFFESLCSGEDVTLWALQKGAGLEQVGGFNLRERLVLPGSELDETNGAFMDSAALAEELDLVVTSDTAMAHLAGALGVRVWLALPFVSDWRWGRHGEFTDWYPSMRIFRQPAAGEWAPVFEAMQAALGELRKAS